MPETIAVQKYREKYRRSIPGLITRIYAFQRSSCKRRGSPFPTYTKEELSSWIMSQSNLSSLYNNWVSSGYDTKLIPSVDRLDNKVSYTLKNIRLTTWKNNHELGTIYISKEVNQFHKNGTFVAKHKSQSEASRSTGVDQSHISKNCRNVTKTAGGFIWKNT